MAVTSFNKYLLTYGVGGILPTWQLLRTASSWQRCGAQPFEVPPSPSGRISSKRCATCSDYVVPDRRPGRSGVGVSQPIVERAPGGAPESAHRIIGNRHGAAAADHAPGADGHLVPGARAGGGSITASVSVSPPICGFTSTQPNIAAEETGFGSVSCPGDVAAPGRKPSSVAISRPRPLRRRPYRLRLRPHR